MGSGRLRYILLFLFILSGLLFSVKFVFADDIQCGDDPKCYEISSPTKIYGAHYKGLVPCGKCVCLHEYDRYGECANYYTVKASPLDTAEGCVDDRYASTSCIYVPCNFCHFFIMFNGIVKFVLIYIVPPIATLILMIGGI
ncbi:hypothetical protein J7J81_01630, partial [bacterium]|nr:hypothetical protein [bacterium]